VLYQPAKFGTKKSTHLGVIAVCVLGYFLWLTLYIESTSAMP